jgi:transglutaminase-like putative cysteine protease
MLARVANGVGMNTNEGVSPLSFQSALGSTNQPAGLVRLEGDYSNNPFSPMMYLRESALSSFNGKEMVFAGRAYDEDLPVTTTRDSFSRREDAELTERTPLIQSIYLLAEHDHAFAVDYPISIVQLKNPRPNRFKSTYRAYSVAPAYTISALTSRQVGDPRWSPDVRDHFLAQHSDTRYADLAKEITKDTSSPIDKVNAITNYLSRTAIYTLTPRHEVKPGEDPVAPFLFGDHRGYCVHFAHAIVYMARSLGIPARVGTGYLTDLSQAKDGHILLRMSDRHAWAEVFVTGIGWIPFDVQPDQVESHAETQIDAKLLEELMGVLEPGEEILPSDLTKTEAGVTEPEAIWVPTRQQVALAITSLLILLVCAKLIILHAWRIAPTRHLAIRLAYIALASRLYDIGFSREFGETRGEFASRVPHGVLDTVALLVTQQAYSARSRETAPRVADVMQTSLTRFKMLPRRSRILAALNPASLLKTTSGLLSGGGW